MDLALIFVKPDGTLRRFSITRDLTRIGRRDDCHLKVQLPEISRQHCQIRVEGQTILVEDLGSTHGTFINGSPVQQGDLVAGDIVTMGNVSFVVQVDGQPEESQVPAIFQSMPGGQLPPDAGDPGASGSGQQDIMIDLAGDRPTS